ncbi:unconventional myosin-XVIIIa isoform X4 [Chrysoperla carnea]|uniref:unconventional myosin-XVIIIa isoform X4 n=1 Tax=Chrysoperla carnea TaxID=189513 RepID=UPI001D080716|nr:unconventional myosin-XVIIIa isoform X4 [Chrysoperla carnea]
MTTSNYESQSTLTSSNYDTAKSHLTANYQLPPVAPVTRKSRPIKKAFTAPLQNLPESTQKIAAVLQTRPLRSGCTSPIPRIKSPQSHEEKVTTGRLLISRSPSPSISNSRASSVSRSCSPSLSRASRSQSLTYSRNSNSSATPRRIFPQEPTKINLDDLRQREPSPVIFDANLSFVIGCKSQMRQNVKTTAAHMDATTASNYLSTKISEFLNRTDHVMDEWKNLGHRGDDEDSFPKSEEQRRILGRSKSAANIAIKGYTLFSKDRSNSLGKSNSLARSRSNSTVRDFFTDDVFSECDELSEMTADLAEEHSTATLAAERLDAETSERIRLERELSEVQNKNKTLQQTSERLEMELLYARSDINGVISEEDEEGEGDTSVYKAKYERAVRELEFTRRRLQQQHEDDLEQLVGLKKQLEKKLSDAYEEVEEQRQVVGQWKRKVQKLTSEMNDLRLLIEEQNARNNLLEKKQRKFDSETQLLQDEVRQEKQQKDRLSREKDILLAEKYTLESNLADVRLELELKEERLNSLQQEYNDITFGGKSDDEVTTLRKQKQDAERRVHEQEEELDDLAGQVQMLEQAKVRLEMSLEQQRKESRREAQQRDDELEEVRCNAQKKVKALEAQLENEHEERTLLLREKHSLERRLAETAEAGRTERQGDEALLQRLKRDLRRTKALLRDAQTMLERNKADNPGKAVIRQLRNQLDDLECARAAAVKAKQTLEGELSDVQSQLDDAHRQKAEAEERANIANRERTDLRTQLEENEEELAEVLKKYRATVQQLSTEQMALQEQISINSDIEAERNSLKEQLAELTMKLEAMETLGDPSSSAQAKRMELRAKELESKLEFEQTTRARLEVQITRLKEATDKLQTDLAHARTKEAQAQDNLRKLQRSLRELREEHTALATRENESLQKRKELEKKLESSEAETVAARADLRLALQRIDDLQAAIQGELEDTISDHSDSDNDSYSSDESIDTFLANHKLSPTKPDRSSLHLDTSPRSNEKRLRVGTPEDSFA